MLLVCFTRYLLLGFTAVISVYLLLDSLPPLLPRSAQCTPLPHLSQDLGTTGSLAGDARFDLMAWIEPRNYRTAFWHSNHRANHIPQYCKTKSVSECENARCRYSATTENQKSQTTPGPLQQHFFCDGIID